MSGRNRHLNGWQKESQPWSKAIPNHNRTMTYLSIMRKILTRWIRDIYYLLISNGMFPEEHKGCRKGTRGTGDQLYIDQHIFKENKVTRKKLAMTRIGYKKAYDVDPQSWIIDNLKMNKQENKNANKSNCMDISSNKQVKSHTKNLDVTKKRKSLREKQNLFK